MIDFVNRDLFCFDPAEWQAAGFAPGVPAKVAPGRTLTLTSEGDLLYEVGDGFPIGTAYRLNGVVWIRLDSCGEVNGGTVRDMNAFLSAMGSEAVASIPPSGEFIVVSRAGDTLALSRGAARFQA